MSGMQYLRGLLQALIIKKKYYGVNISVSIQGIALKHFSALPKTEINSTTPSCQRHAVFQSFLSDDIKHDADNTNAQSKHLI